MVSNDLVEINGTLNKFSGSGAWQGEVKGTCWVLMEYGDWRYVENGSPVEPGKKNNKTEQPITLKVVAI